MLWHHILQALTSPRVISLINKLPGEWVHAYSLLLGQERRMRVIWFGAGLAAFLAVWLSILQTDLDDNLRLWAQLAPLLAVGLFGLYCVLALTYGVATFRSCPEEYELLQKEILEAKAELRKLGVLAEGTTQATPPS
mmetsp:Transcript_14268/g.40433  ORF Transcript_14268/g.40433 Transcript_14268/m.40433 type:complete len:137 (-) Transcript_14268:102-512(-)